MLFRVGNKSRKFGVTFCASFIVVIIINSLIYAIFFFKPPLLVFPFLEDPDLLEYRSAAIYMISGGILFFSEWILFCCYFIAYSEKRLSCSVAPISGALRDLKLLWATIFSLLLVSSAFVALIDTSHGEGPATLLHPVMGTSYSLLGAITYALWFSGKLTGLQSAVRLVVFSLPYFLPMFVAPIILL